jgi:glyoxylase-like metal-dependent hydrolase (beta-lactamase superfamily II)
VKDLIDRSGDLRIQRGYACTPGHSATPPPRSRPVDHTVLSGADETFDGVQLRFEAVADAETNTQLVIALPGAGVLISQDVLYNGVHSFLGEHAFDTWQAAITALEALPYETIIPGHGLPRGDGLPNWPRHLRREPRVPDRGRRGVRRSHRPGGSQQAPGSRLPLLRRHRHARPAELLPVPVISNLTKGEPSC